MNLILFSREELADGPDVWISDRRFVHLREVLRAQVGEAFAAGEIDGRLGTATLRELESGRARVEVALTAEPPPPLGVELLLALPRPKILRKVLQAAASMGCKRIALVKSFRVEKSYLGSPFVQPEAIRDELLLGLEQGRDTKLPTVSVHQTFKPFIEDELDSIFPGSARLLPHPNAAHGLPSLDAQPTVLAIGPEGGWTEFEARMLEERGFAPFSAGSRVLRVDVAVPFLVGQVALGRAR